MDSLGNFANTTSQMDQYSSSKDTAQTQDQDSLYSMAFHKFHCPPPFELPFVVSAGSTCARIHHVLEATDHILFPMLEEEDPLMTAPIVETPIDWSTLECLEDPIPAGVLIEEYPTISETLLSRPLFEDEDKPKPSRKRSCDQDGIPRFRDFQAEQWQEKLDELVQYKATTGSCMIPHRFADNGPLARWVKRQRYQYKLMLDGERTTMTPDRAKVLSDIGFIWDSQTACWYERLEELKQFKGVHGHTNVPTNSSENPQLATWIKCQRRQFKLFMQGGDSHITAERIRDLEAIDFEWEVRGSKRMRFTK